MCTLFTRNIRIRHEIRTGYRRQINQILLKEQLSLQEIFDPAARIARSSVGMRILINFNQVRFLLVHLYCVIPKDVIPAFEGIPRSIDDSAIYEISF